MPRVVTDAAGLRGVLRKRLLQQPEIVFAYLFGSFPEGLPCRDIDIAVFVEPAALSAENAFDLETRLSIDLSRAAGMPVDLRVLNHAPIGFQHSVLQGELLLARDELRLGNFIERVSAAYMDFAWLGRAFLRDLLGA